MNTIEKKRGESTSKKFEIPNSNQMSVNQNSTNNLHFHTQNKAQNQSKEFPTPSSGDSFGRDELNTNRNIDFTRVETIHRNAGVALPNQQPEVGSFVLQETNPVDRSTRPKNQFFYGFQHQGNEVSPRPRNGPIDITSERKKKD